MNGISMCERLQRRMAESMRRARGRTVGIALAWCIGAVPALAVDLPTDNAIDGTVFKEIGGPITYIDNTSIYKWVGRWPCSPCLGSSSGSSGYLLDKRVYDRFDTTSIPAGATITSLRYRFVLLRWGMNAGGGASNALWRLSWGDNALGDDLDTGDYWIDADGYVDADPDLFQELSFNEISLPTSAFVRTTTFDVQVRDHSAYDEGNFQQWNLRAGDYPNPSGPFLRVNYTLGGLSRAVDLPPQRKETTWGALKGEFTK